MLKLSWPDDESAAAGAMVIGVHLCRQEHMPMPEAPADFFDMSAVSTASEAPYQWQQQARTCAVFRMALLTALL